MSKSDNDILNLAAKDARAFFMRKDSYCNIDLPHYIAFEKILAELDAENLDTVKTQGARNSSDCNYTLVCNKDGRYAWRPLQIINPVIYTKLVQKITQTDNWQTTKSRFDEFQQNKSIICTSIPVVKNPLSQSKPEQILHWWSAFEQKSVELSLEYNHIFTTDITDCYGSIYTHSIAWAVHGKEEAKTNRNDHNLLGNAIDDLIMDMRCGQTNGISQGSILMDFIAEIVLGYADFLLSQKIDDLQKADYKILRYRDDYRIFVNSTSVGELILKHLTEILYEFGMRLNSSKTKSSSDVIYSAVKEDKQAWLRIGSNFNDLTIQKKLLLLYRHAHEFPNCGSLLKPLNQIHIFLGTKEEIHDRNALIAIVAEIAYQNPRTYQVCIAIIAKLLQPLTAELKKSIGEKLLNKFKSLPNTEYLEIWLQRILYPCKINLDYSCKLSELVVDSSRKLWNFDWLNNTQLKAKISDIEIIDTAALAQTSAIMQQSEVDLFADKYETDYP